MSDVELLPVPQEGGEQPAGNRSIRSTVDNNILIMLNGEPVFAKFDGESPTPRLASRQHVLSGGVVPGRPKDINRIDQDQSSSAQDDSLHEEGSQIFDQSTLEAEEDGDLRDRNRSISPIGDTSSGSMLQIAREIDMMDGSYFTTCEQPVLPEERTNGSILSSRGMAQMNDVSSSSDEEDDSLATKKYPLSTPYRSIHLTEDWVKAWGQSWGLKVNKVEEIRRRNRLSALQAKHERSRLSSTDVQEPAPRDATEQRFQRGEGPSIMSVLGSARKQAASPPPSGPKSPAKLLSPWDKRVQEWTLSNDDGGFKTPSKESSVQDQSIASAEKTVRKSTWVFGDDESETEDEEDVKLGEDNRDGEEPWKRSAKKQHHRLESYRKTLGADTTVTIQKERKGTVQEQRKSERYKIRQHAVREREQQVCCDDEDPADEQDRIKTYTPDIAKLRQNRQKLRDNESDEEEDYRPLFRRADGRLVRNARPVATSLDESMAPPTFVSVDFQDRVGAWV